MRSQPAQTDNPIRSGPGWLAGLLLLTSLASAGCDDASDEDQIVEAPFSGESIRVGVPSGYGLLQPWQLVADEWSVRTAAEVSIDEYDAVTDESGSVSVPDGTHLAVVPITSAASLAAAGRTIRLPVDSLQESELDWNDVIRGLRDRACSYDSHPRQVPISCPVFVCYYRKDLLDASKLDEPATWADYQALLDTLDQWAPGSIAVEPWGANWRASLFLARGVAPASTPGSYSLFFDIDSGRPLINSPGFERSLVNIRLALSKMPPEVLNYSPANCRRELLSGRAALGIAFEEHVAGPSTGEPAPDIRNRPEGARIGFCRLPGAAEVYDRESDSWRRLDAGTIHRPALTGFTGLCAVVTDHCSSRQALAATNLLAELLLDNADSSLPATARSLCRESQMNYARTWLGSHLAPDEAGRYAHAVATSLRDDSVISELPVPGRSGFLRSLADRLGPYLSGDAEAKDILQQVETDWTQLIDAAGDNVVRDAYRSSLGLAAPVELN